ncbi:translocation/assembly module TamB domain-containing protein [Candidatus Neomarinimicrobiota bacterium]
MDLNFHSTITPNEYGLNINLDSLTLNYGDLDYFFELNKTKININNRTVNLISDQGSFNTISFFGDLTFVQSFDQQLRGNVSISNINVPEKYSEILPTQPNLSNLNTNIIVNTNFIDYSGIININNNLGFNVDCDFKVTKQDDNWLAQRILLKSKNTCILANGSFNNKKYINANIDLEKLDLSEWVIGQKPTSITGIAKVKMFFDNEKINSVNLDIQAKESTLLDKETISIDGEFVYENNEILFSKPVALTVGTSSVTSVGKIDFIEKEVDLKLIVRDVDNFIINKLWNDSLQNGIISGELEAYGKLNNPKISGTLRAKDIKYSNLFLSEIEIDGFFEKNNGFSGYAQARLGSGNWKDIDFDSGKIDVELKNKETHFKSVNFVNGEDYFVGSGRIDQTNDIHVSSIKASYQNHVIANSAPFIISFGESYLKISPFEAQVDDGIIKGELLYDKLYKGNIVFSNIDSEILHPFIDNYKYRFTGQMFGEIILNAYAENENYTLDAYVNNGSFSDMSFQQLTTSIEYNSQKLVINEFLLKDTDKYHIDIKGTIPLGNSTKTEKLQIQSSIYNTNIKMITQFLPFKLELTGIINGGLNIDGTWENMIGDYNIEISDATFEKILFGTVKSNGSYDGNRIDFQFLSSNNNDNYYNGYGYLPINLYSRSDTLENISTDNDLYVFVEGKANNLDVITNYFDEVDATPGEYTFTFELNGTWDNTISNGTIRAQNAKIFTPYLDKPIKKVHGVVRIVDNKLIIDNLNGKMHRKSKSKRKNKDNVSLTGGMDITNLFDPYLNIRVIGKKAYFKSPIYKSEGITDFDLNITGKDTVLIMGSVSPQDITILQKFTINDLGALPLNPDDIILHYNVEIPIKGKMSLSSDQFNAVLTGHVNINQLGSRNMDLAGELIIEKGEFYYYGDIFKITGGKLLFDNNGFNPQMDILANTTIDGERIYISIIGTFDNPQFLFTSESGFSQSDILEILTMRKRFSVQDAFSSEILYRTSGIAYSWIGNQLDKNILNYTKLNRLGILGNVKVSGIAGLFTDENKEFSISKPITDNLSANYAYRNSFGLLDSYQALGLELQLGPYISLISNIDRNGYIQVKYRIRYSY